MYLKEARIHILGIVIGPLFWSIFSAMEILLICILVCFPVFVLNQELSLCQLKKTNTKNSSHSLNSSELVNILSLHVVTCCLSWFQTLTADCNQIPGGGTREEKSIPNCSHPFPQEIPHMSVLLSFPLLISSLTWAHETLTPFPFCFLWIKKKRGGGGSMESNLKSNLIINSYVGRSWWVVCHTQGL